MSGEPGPGGWEGISSGDCRGGRNCLYGTLPCAGCTEGLWGVFERINIGYTARRNPCCFYGLREGGSWPEKYKRRNLWYNLFKQRGEQNGGDIK